MRRAIVVAAMSLGLTAEMSAAAPPLAKVAWPWRLTQTPLRTDAAKRAATDYLVQQATVAGATRYSLMACTRRRLRAANCWGTIGPIRVCIGNNPDPFNCPYRLTAGRGFAMRVRADYGRVQVRERWSWDVPSAAR